MEELHMAAVDDGLQLPSQMEEKLKMENLRYEEHSVEDLEPRGHQ